jgi:peptidoglycan/LPS O-acetylase OafA/YrhL
MPPLVIAMTPISPVFLEESSIPNSLQNKIPDPTVSLDYYGRMNVVRFIAICSVVWGHCLLGLENRVFSQDSFKIIQAVMLQAGRVGTIMFFIISGFLLFNKIDRFSPAGYVRYRFKSVIRPWAIFLLLLVLVQLFEKLTPREIFAGHLFDAIKLFWALVKGAVFYAAYWFIPVSIISAVMLIALKRYVGKLWFGMILLALSLFYSVNLYKAWIPVNHTEAVFGYLFYLWLGMQINKHIYQVKYVLTRISAIILAIAWLFIFWLACAEGMNLTRMGCADAYGSLRLSNAVLSILLFLILLKSHRLTFVDWLHPRQNTYGIYLVHSFVVMALVPYVNKFMAAHNLYLKLPGFAVVQIMFFVSVLAITFCIVTIIRHSALRIALGLSNKLPESG